MHSEIYCPNIGNRPTEKGLETPQIYPGIDVTTRNHGLIVHVYYIIHAGTRARYALRHGCHTLHRLFCSLANSLNHVEG